MKQVVKQKTLSGIMKLRRSIKFAKEEMEKESKLLSRMEQDVSTLLSQGWKVEPGKYTAGFEDYQPATRPPWKDLYVNHMVTIHGASKEATEADIKEEYKEEMTKRLVVAEVGQ